MGPFVVQGVRFAAGVLALILATFPARSDMPEPQCWTCLRSLAMRLPAVNPQEDSSYEDGLTPGSVLPALASCSLDDSELPDLRKIIQIFTDASMQRDGVVYVKERLEQLPQMKADDRARLLDGARQDLQTTLRHLIDHNCRLLLQSHFDEGASRDWILKMIAIGSTVENH